jgi:hypothetical protein
VKVVGADGRLWTVSEKTGVFGQPLPDPPLPDPPLLRWIAKCMKGTTYTAYARSIADANELFSKALGTDYVHGSATPESEMEGREWERKVTQSMEGRDAPKKPGE